jgi:hypothetical protein
MAAPRVYRWRKATDINREHALFELMDGESILLDVGFSDEGIFEIAFHDGIGGTVLGRDRFLTLLEEGRALAEADR